MLITSWIAMVLVKNNNSFKVTVTLGYRIAAISRVKSMVLVVSSSEMMLLDLRVIFM